MPPAPRLHRACRRHQRPIDPRTVPIPGHSTPPGRRCPVRSDAAGAIQRPAVIVPGRSADPLRHCDRLPGRSQHRRRSCSTGVPLARCRSVHCRCPRQHRSAGGYRSWSFRRCHRRTHGVAACTAGSSGRCHSGTTSAATAGSSADATHHRAAYGRAVRRWPALHHRTPAAARVPMPASRRGLLPVRPGAAPKARRRGRRPAAAPGIAGR